MTDNSGEAFKRIGDEGGTEALALVATYLDQSAAANDRLQNFLYEQMERDRDEWRERALVAEDKLWRTQCRFVGLVFGYDVEENA